MTPRMLASKAGLKEWMKEWTPPTMLEPFFAVTLKASAKRARRCRAL